ncbi:MAG: DUF4317 domain-containing protein [Clostridia bacterium]|nr:DUF4317 domain-containing protein [Clostridia bacterium]
MNEKEVAEIRRRFRADKTNINYVRGIFVNEKREIISEFNQSLGMLSEEEANAILSVIKKALSGSVGKNLIDISFSNQQVLESEEHKLLTALRESELGDAAALSALYEKILPAVDIEGNFLLMTAYDCFDVFSKGKDGGEDSASSFSYIICAVCPIKTSQYSLTYYLHENKLRNVCEDAVVCAPELGFMFPAYEDHAANIHNALYYSKNTANSHEGFVTAVFNTELPMPAQEQKETFNSLLAEAVAEDCSYDVVETVHAELSNIIDTHKENREEEPLVIGKSTVADILKSCGVEETKLEDFSEKFDEAFGENTQLSPANIIDRKNFQLKTPDVVVKVDPEKLDVVETRVIDGTKYILIRADNDVEVNGVNIKIKK